MEKGKKKLSKVAVGFLLIPPVLNYFNQENYSHVSFFNSSKLIPDLKNNLEIWKKEKKESLFQFISNLLSSITNRHISELLSDSKLRKIVFVNYPLKKEDLVTVEEGIKISKVKRSVIIYQVLFPESLEKMVFGMKNERLFCPFCGISSEKKAVIFAENFKCLNCGIDLSQKDIEKFNQDYLNFYFGGFSIIIEHYKNQGYKLNFIELIMKEDFIPEVLKKYIIEKM